jgi:hypothetical protein
VCGARRHHRGGQPIFPLSRPALGSGTLCHTVSCTAVTAVSLHAFDGDHCAFAPSSFQPRFSLEGPMLQPSLRCRLTPTPHCLRSTRRIFPLSRKPPQPNTPAYNTWCPHRSDYIGWWLRWVVQMVLTCLSARWLWERRGSLSRSRSRARRERVCAGAGRAAADVPGARCRHSRRMRYLCWHRPLSAAGRGHSRRRGRLRWWL